MMNIGLVGCGEYARTAYLPAILAHSRLRLVSICSRTAQSAHALHSRLPPVMQAEVTLYSEDSSIQSYQTLLDDKSIVGVLIALPIPVQAQAVSLALKAGKHVLSEKPIARNVAVARSLIREFELSRQLHGDQVWQVAENWTLLPAVVYAAQRVQELGRILGFRTRQSLMMPADSPFLASGWRAAPDFKGGLMIDGAVHGAAVLRTLLGPEHQVERVCAFSNSLQRHLPAPDTLDAIIEAKSGVTGVMQMFYGTTFAGPVFEIACEGGVVVMDGFDSVTVTSADGQNANQWTGGGLGESVAHVFDAWADAITTRTCESRLGSGDALLDISLVEAMLQSAQEKGVPCRPLSVTGERNSEE
ncbi:1,5-anhydro-D-fructose reductase (1,5-anhydro-D-mannitol-forming) [Microdochium nivale]|nr:1,5-anhydro-D-fructose reductase (1,5-anhydro-D-mannitol-forming) [Microdochium nivale]